MKKILIVSNNYRIGGIQKAFLEFVKETSKYYEISILVFDDSGPLSNELPENVKKLPSNKALSLLTISLEDAKKLGKSWYFMSLFLKTFSHFFSNKVPFKLLMSRFKHETNYDIAISFVHSNDEKYMYHGCNEFVLNKINADKKYTFIHADYRTHDGNTDHNNNLLNEFDKVIGVSKSVAMMYKKVNSRATNDIDYLYNFYDIDSIITKSEEFDPNFDAGILHFVTVSRLSPEKGLLEFVDVVEKLSKNHSNFKWHVVGDGPLMDEIQREVKRRNLVQFIILEGEKKNPYPFIHAADYFVLPSKYEAAPVVYGESAILDTPIISTHTLSSEEIVKQNGLGYVVEDFVQLYNLLNKILISEESLIPEGELSTRIIEMQKHNSKRLIEEVI